MYWDLIDYPDNNLISIGASPDIEFLISSGVATRTRVQFGGMINSGNGEFFIVAQKAVFDRYEKENPGCWSIAQVSQQPFFPDSKPKTSIEYELLNNLPVPEYDVPLNEILEFKAKRKDELTSFRIYIDELYQSIINAGDIPRAKNTAILKIEKALSDVDRTLDESAVKRTITSLKGYIAGDFTGVAGIGIGMAGLSSMIGLTPLNAGMMGVGIAFAVKAVLSPSAKAGTNPLTYISSIKKGI